MNKKSLASILIVVFTTSILAPAIVALLDDRADISLYCDMAEEESDTDANNLELTDLFCSTIDVSYEDLFTVKTAYYHFKTYRKTVRNLATPPPEDFI